MDGDLSQVVEPSHHRGSKARRKHFAQKFVVLRIKSHKMHVMTYMLYWVRITVETSK